MTVGPQLARFFVLLSFNPGPQLWSWCCTHSGRVPFGTALTDTLRKDRWRDKRGGKGRRKVWREKRREEPCPTIHLVDSNSSPVTVELSHHKLGLLQRRVLNIQRKFVPLSHPSELPQWRWETSENIKWKWMNSFQLCVLGQVSHSLWPLSSSRWWEVSWDLPATTPWGSLVWGVALRAFL